MVANCALILLLLKLKRRGELKAKDTNISPPTISHSEHQYKRGSLKTKLPILTAEVPLNWK